LLKITKVFLLNRILKIVFTNLDIKDELTEKYRMKIKSIVMAVIAASTFAAGATTVIKPGMLKEVAGISKASASAQKSKVKLTTLQDKTSQASYFKANKHEGVKRYIVRLSDSSVASYKGNVAGYEKTNSAAKKNGLNNVKFNPKSTVSLKYVSYLEQKQSELLSEVSSNLGFNMPNLMSYKYAINGMLTELTFEQAKAVGNLPSVKFIEQEQIFQLETDTGPGVIGAPAVWDGTAGSVAYQGEGLIIGNIDSGINTDHPSFAATGDDGYTVVNPLGDGVYLGDCVADPTLCNSKLIGVRSFADLTAAYATFPPANQRPANGEDYGGHGSHTASTAAGNKLNDVNVSIPYAYGGEVNDGYPTGYVTPQMSGVAPHANIISYQICYPGSSGDTYSGCFGSLAIASIEQAILDGVDVLNYSISSSTQSPWDDATDVAFLSANAAGIFVATSAGNSGPGVSTTSKASPWYTSVGATTTGQGGTDFFGGVVSIGKTVGTFTGGDTTVPAEMTGGGANGAFTGDIVYAGDFTNSNDPTGDPAQCLEDFPAATFTATQIVVCDRGAIARVEKAENVAAGGAGGFILVNANADQTLAEDFYEIPGIQINFDDGVALKTWLATGTDHVGTIGAATYERLVNTVDVMASFSSRGPNLFAGSITPSIAAPGAAILGAYADDQPFNDANGPSSSDFNIISGTSMASPHIAGAAALVMQANPTWNPDQVRSALMMTASTSVTKEDGETPADAFDMGAGRVQVDLAINAGLVMSESEANYEVADPALGGDPTTLNTPSLADYACAFSCSWTRTFTIITDGTYSLSSSSAALTMDTTTITGVAGDNVSVTFTLDVSTSTDGEFVFDQVTITSAEQPTLHLPVAVRVEVGSIPDDVHLTVGRNNGSWNVSGLTTIATNELEFVVDGVFDNNAVGLSEVVPFEIAQDPTNGSGSELLDIELGGLFHFPVTVGVNTASFTSTISEATATDFDLWILFDSDDNGSFETVADRQADGDTNESVTLTSPAAGSYLVVVQNWGASAAAKDTGILTVNVVPVTDPLPGLTVIAPTSNDGAVDIRLAWDIDMVEGDSYRADVSAFVGTSRVGTFNVLLDRVGDDFIATNNRSLVSRGERIEYTLRLNSSPYQEAIDYSVAIDMPDNMTILDGSVSGGGVITLNGEQGFNWATSSIVPVSEYIATDSANDASCADAAFGGYFNLADANGPGTFAPIDFEGDSVSTTLFAEINVPLYGVDHDGITITDDGFAFLSGSSGNTPWINAPIPTESAPNDMIAMLWMDLEVFNTGDRGVRVATLGGNDFMIDFDEIGAFDDDTQSFSYNLFVYPDATDAAGDFEFVVAYSDTQVGDFSSAVAGIENIDGTAGTDTSSLVAPDVQICYDLNTVTSDPVEVKFTVVTQPGYAGQTAAPDVTVTSSMVSTEDLVFRADPVAFANVAPVANAGSDMTYDRATPPTLVILSAAGSTDLDGDTLSYSWEQSDGDSVVLTAGLAGDPNIADAHFNFASAENGVYRFRVTVSDGNLSSTDEVSITIEGKDKSGGDGSMGMLLLLIAGSLFIRRKLKK